MVFGNSPRTNWGKPKSEKLIPIEIVYLPYPAGEERPPRGRVSPSPMLHFSTGVQSGQVIMGFTSQKMVYEIPGEPVIVVNGLPSVSPNGDNLAFCSAITDTELCGNEGFCQWLEGRGVRKVFGNRFYTGKVTKYDKEMHWYKVVYEDGDSEDLEWHELKEILLPLDINIPLKTLAMNIINKKQLDMMNIPLTTQPRTITKTTQKPLQQTAKAKVQARYDYQRSGGKD